MAAPIFKFVFALVVTVTMLIQEVRPRPVIVESTEFEKGIFGNKAKKYLGDYRQRGRHVRLSSDLPKLVQDLYTNVKAITDKQEKNPATMLNYNTVRSFESTIKEVEDSFLLTFDIAAIEERELIFKAELYLDISYTMDLKIELAHKDYRIETEVNGPSTSSKMLKFQIGTYVAALLDADNFTNNLLEFTLLVWKVNSDGDSETKVSISDDNEVVLHQDPTLVVYSYDNNEAKTPLLESLQKKLLDFTSQDTVSKREVQQTEATCGLSSVIVKKEVLNDILKGTHHTIILPDTFDAGVCGGNCIGTFSQETLHTTILHLLLTGTASQPAEIGDPESYKRCCAPVQYSEMSMLTRLDDPAKPVVYEIKVFSSVSVKTCSCIYTKE